MPMPFSKSTQPLLYKYSDVRIAAWSFAIGAFLVVAFLLLYRTATYPWWEDEIGEVIVTLIGSG